MIKALITIFTSLLMVFGLIGCGDDQATIGTGIGANILHVEKALKKGSLNIPAEFVDEGKVQICHGYKQKKVIHVSENAVPAHGPSNWSGAPKGNGNGKGHTDDYLIAVENWVAVGSSCPNVPPSEEEGEGEGSGGSGSGEEGGSGSGEEGGSGSGGGGSTGGTGGSTGGEGGSTGGTGGSTGGNENM